MKTKTNKYNTEEHLLFYIFMWLIESFTGVATEWV